MKLVVATSLVLLSFNSHAGLSQLYADAAAWPHPIYIGITGDSISGGGGGLGPGLLYFPSVISNYSGGVLKSTNSSAGDTRWESPAAAIAAGRSVISNQVFLVLRHHPRWVYVHLGVNNGNDCFITNQMFPCVWSSKFEPEMNGIATQCAAAGAGMILGEILPAFGSNFNAFAYPGVRLVNTAYANWCNTNQFSNITRMSVQHDYFAVSNNVTHEMDSLKDTYWQSDADRLHLSLAAYNLWGPLFVNNLAEAFPGSITVNILNIGP